MPEGNDKGAMNYLPHPLWHDFWPWKLRCVWCALERMRGRRVSG